MDQPAIYSETVREGIGGACRRVGVSACRRVGDAATRRRGERAMASSRNGSKPARANPWGKRVPGRAEFFALPIFRRASRWNVPGSRLQATDRSANL